MGLHMDLMCISTMYPIELEKIFSDYLKKQKCLYPNLTFLYTSTIYM